MYLQYLHHAVLFSIQQPIGNGPVNAAASKLLIEISQDLGVPVTCSQVKLLMFIYFLASWFTKLCF